MRDAGYGPWQGGCRGSGGRPSPPPTTLPRRAAGAVRAEFARQLTLPGGNFPAGKSAGAAVGPVLPVAVSRPRQAPRFGANQPYSGQCRAWVTSGARGHAAIAARWSCTVAGRKRSTHPLKVNSASQYRLAPLADLGGLDQQAPSRPMTRTTTSCNDPHHDVIADLD
jgi:hypothetical protein